MLYLVTDTFRTSLWPYAAFQTEIPVLRTGQKIMVPTAITAWPDPLNKMPPREFVERSRGNIFSQILGSS
jgi:microsomal epoxide hydrolase